MPGERTLLAQVLVLSTLGTTGRDLTCGVWSGVRRICPHNTITSSTYDGAPLPAMLPVGSLYPSCR